MIHPPQPKEPARFAAPAPNDEGDQAPALDNHDRDLDLLCERWVVWSRTRRLYAPPPVSGSVLGRLRTSTRPLRPGAGDADISAELAAFHIAYTCQPQEALDRRVFDLYYVVRVKPIKVAADALGISRKHFYSVLGQFRQRVYGASIALLEKEQHSKEVLGSWRVSKHV